MAAKEVDAMDVPLDVKKHGKAEARSWLSQGGGDSSDNQEKIAAVRLPSTDSRKPLGNDASIVVVTDMATDSDHHSSLSSTSSFASSSSCLPRTPVIMRVKLPLHNRDQVVKKLTKHPLLRASQGPCGNEGIKAARQRFLQEKAANQRESRIAQQSLKTLDKGYHTTGMPPLSPALNVHRSESSTSPRSGDSTSCSLASHVAGCQAVIEVPQRLLTTARQMPMNGRSNVTHNTSSSYGRSSGAPKHSSGRPQNGSNYLSNAGNGNATYGNGRTDRDDWTSWVELSVKVFDLPTTISTRDLWKAFSREGSVKSIELYEDARGVRQGRASIRFSPSPARPFWECGRHAIHVSGNAIIYARLQLEGPKRTFLHPSPVDPSKKYPELMEMHAESLEFGMMFDPNTMMSMYKVRHTPKAKIHFRQNMLHREIIVQFQLDIRDHRVPPGNLKISQLGKYNRTETLRFRLPFSQLQVVRQPAAEVNKLVMLISMESPPKFFKLLDALKTHDENARFWSDGDAWYRQTDVVYAPNALKNFPLTLKKTRPIIDLGRWTTYRLVFDMSENKIRHFELMRRALKDYNVETTLFPDFRTITPHKPAVWTYIDEPSSRAGRSTTALVDLAASPMFSLAFSVRYQLEVCISQGYLNEYNLNRDFITKLAEMEALDAQDLLEYVANQGRRVFDPMSVFNIKISQSLAMRASIPNYCVHTRSATITPTTMHFNTPTVDTSNRIIRQFSEYADRFLRIRFSDEMSEGKIYSTNKETTNEVFTRIKRALTNGITIGDRHYQYLASGNSQFREHGAYFFAPLPRLSTEKIRSWMGSFSHIDTVAKYASRLGQCFSTTRAIGGARATIVEIQDIKRNGFVFTDGVGKISELLAQLTACELGIPPSPHGPPSAFQFRLGGCKGVLAVSPSSGPREIHIRNSQYKFPASHEGLEIIRWSQYACANLNRQLILVLSALGVPDAIFIQKLQLQLSNLKQAMTDELMALSILQKEIDHNQMTLVLASMILDGFQRTEEPFLSSLLQLWRAWSIKYLKEKARITIGDGALLLGCVDETGILQGHSYSTPQPSSDASLDEKAGYLPQVFVQVSRNSEAKPEVILGPMLLARNPSLHPGDIRVVCGVDVPDLYHLKDVVVLPQTGDRDVASMCSGGDLDGDDFLVVWDRDLLPRELNHEPMDYSPPEPIRHDGDITTDDLTTFFVTYMKNDTLSRIAHAHVANADYLDEGVKDDRCLKLAALHSMAVDFVKTGQPAQMSRDLFPRKWPHFMEKKKPLEQTYHSRKVLGQLYDQVERVDFVPAFTAPFDSRILEAYELGEEILHNAYEVKVDYDAHMRRIMAQQEIGTEFEVWSTFVLHHAKGSGDYKYHEQIGELSMALKDQFRALCYEQAGGKQFEQIGPFVAAMYQVTAREMLEALKECSQSQLVGGHRQPCRMMTSAKMPLMSFPWLFQGVLGKIASNNTFAKTETTIVQDEITSNVEIVRDMTESNKFKRHRVNPDLQDMGDDLETADGTTHRGDLLELFENSGRAIVCKDTDELGAVPSGATSIRSSRSSTSTSMGAASSIDEMLFSESLSNSPGLLASEPRDQSTHPTFDPTVLASALARGSSTLANEQGSNHDPCSNDTTTMKGDYNGASDSSSEIEVPAPVATSPGIHQILNRRAGPNSLGNASQAEYEYVSAHDKILYDDDDVVDTDDGDGGDIDKPTKAELMPVAPNMRVLREEEPENVKTKKLSAKDEFDNFSDTDSGSEQYAIASETKAGLLDQLMLIGGEAEFAIRDAKYIEASRSTS